MLQPFDQLGLADQAAGAAASDIVALAHGLGAADRAMGREDVGDGVRRAPLQHDRDDLGDDIAGALQHDGVAYADVLAGDLVLVVEGGIADHHAADGHGREAGHGRQGAGAADLDVDALQHGGRLLRGELVGDGPAGATGDESEALLPVQPVDLVDHPVDVVAECRAVGLEGAINVQQSLRPRDAGRAGVGLEAPFSEAFQRPGLGVTEAIDRFPPGIGEELQGPARRDFRVLLSQRAGGEIAGVGVGAPALGLGRDVEGGEGLGRGIDLAPHLDPGRPAGTAKS